MIAKPYTATRLHVAWIQFITLFYTIWACLKIIAHAFLTADKQRSIDKVTTSWANHLLKSTGLKVKVHNPHNQTFEPGRPIILMCNHSSLFDIPVSYAAIPGSIRMLTKKELFKIPILGTALSRGGWISVDRKNSEQARKDLRRARKELEQGIMLWIAPEGTRSRDGKLHKFKKGGFHLAIETGAIIVPIVICGISKVLPSNTIELTINGEVDVHIGREFDASRFDNKQRNDLLNSVEDEMRELLKNNI